MERFIESTTTEALIDSKQKNKNSHISLFTGCGGLDIGFAQAGWKTRAMVEWDKDACKTLRANWTKKGREECWQSHIKNFRENGDEEQATKMERKGIYYPKYMRGAYREPAIFQRDIRTLSAQEVLEASDLKIGECGCMTGGFPCQGFSSAGARMIDDPRNSLYKECVRMLREILPHTFLFENVPGLISMDKGRIIDQICTDFAESGYQLSWQKLNAADFGVPQNRIRIFFLGTRNDKMIFPESGNPAFHIGAYAGPVKVPGFYTKKYGIHNKYEDQSKRQQKLKII